MAKKLRQPQLKKLKHPMQPIGFDEHGVIRFKKNAIVDALLSRLGTFDMNHIVVGVETGVFSKEDYTQFVQLIGYSVSGAGELSRFNRKVIQAADVEAARIWAGKDAEPVRRGRATVRCVRGAGGAHYWKFPDGTLRAVVKVGANVDCQASAYPLGTVYMDAVPYRRKR